MTSQILKRIAILAVFLIPLTACTSSLVLGTAYNAAAKKAATRAKSYADFDDSQQQWIDQSFKSFHQWHRVSELPAYNTLLNEIAQSLRSDQPTARSSLKGWLDEVQERGQIARSCSPLSGATDFLANMADWQIPQLDRKLRSNRKEQYEKYQNETVAERRERRLDLMVKWASRAGLKLTTNQQEMLAETLARQTSMGEQRFKLWDKWTDQFIALLKSRNSNKFPDQVQSHIKSLWTLTEKNYPEQWQQSRELWLDFAHRLTNDLSREQKSALALKIQSIAGSVKTLSQKKSRTTPVCFG